MKYILILLLSGCANVQMMSNLHVDNSARNNFVGNPCGFYVNDYCLMVKSK